jgi:SAM-dependent methyltransferase
MDYSKVTEGNRAAWNAAADAHRAVRWDIILEELAGKRPGPMAVPALDMFEQVDYVGKDILHLACNNGRELLWLKRQGAGRCVGVDIADKFIDQGRELSALSGWPAEFLQANIIDLDGRYDGSFDFVLTTHGMFNWQPDLPALMQVAARLLRPGGKVLIDEIHPVTWMMEPDKGEEFQYSYFDAETYSEAEPLDYYDGTSYDAPVRYEFQRPLGLVFQSILDAGLRIASFKEFPIDTSGDLAHLENRKAQLPLSYNLIAEK